MIFLDYLYYKFYTYAINHKSSGIHDIPFFGTTAVVYYILSLLWLTFKGLLRHLTGIFITWDTVPIIHIGIFLGLYVFYRYTGRYKNIIEKFQHNDPIKWHPVLLFAIITIILLAIIYILYIYYPFT